VPDIAFVNEKFMPLGQATVHVEDRGFQFADGVYEAVRTYHGRPFALDEHLARLDLSLAGIKLVAPLSRSELAGIVHEGIRLAGYRESVVYIQITRGVAPRHRRFPTNTKPTVVLTFRECPPVSDTPLGKAIRIVTLDDFRWGWCHIKSVALLASVLAYEQAHAAGADDAVFVEPDGTVTESTAGNLFVVKESRVRTPPLGPKLLAGITRGKFIEAARSIGLTCDELPVTRDDLYAADEVCLTSTTVELVAVKSVDNRPVGGDKAGPVTTRMFQQFRKVHAGA
jgi:D-alanine transaminase